MRLARFVPMLLPILLACKDAGSPSAALPASFQVIWGADQVATVARELPQAVEVRVVDASAGPVPNYPINWQALDGGQAFTTVVYSGTDGIARQRWTLGSQAWANAGGPGTPDPAAGRMRQRLVARALHPETGAVLVDDTVLATGRPDVAVRLALANAGAFVGESTAVAVLFYDQYDNVLARCPNGGAWQDLNWWSGDSTVALPTGQLIWSVFDGDSLPYGYVRGLTAGATTIGVTASCLATPASFTFTVTTR